MVYALQEAGQAPLATFGVAGQHLSATDTLQMMKYPKIRPSFSIKRLTAQMNDMDRVEIVRAALSTYYYGLYVAPHRQIAMRLYAKPAPEWTYQKLDSLYQKDKYRFSEQIGPKPTFLQIYDLANNDRLIFDGPVPTPFKVLEVDKEGYLWAIAGQDAEEKRIIRKFRLVRE
jgi:hypothetical protein